MDEATRKALEDTYSQLMRAAKNIRKLLDGDASRHIQPCELQHASIAGIVTPEILQKPADKAPARE